MPKIWFITGCSKGFGRVLTQQLLNTTDALVVATARNPAALSDLEKIFPTRLLALQLDVTSKDQIKAAVERAMSTFGRIDVLVNNAGYGLIGALEECSDTEIRAIFDTNLFGVMDVTKAVLPHMRQQKSGYVMNISSIAGLRSSAGAGLYNSTKFALEGLSEALVLEVAHFGIKVTIIEPGPFRTDFAGDSIKMTTPLPAYQESSSMITRDYLGKAHQNQAGDPVKAAKIMIDLAEMPSPPLRMLLGNAAANEAKAKCESLVAEFSAYDALSRSADYV